MGDGHWIICFGSHMLCARATFLAVYMLCHFHCRRTSRCTPSYPMSI